MEKKVKKIAIIGSGYVGTTTAALLAHAGYSVVALDIDQKKVDILNSGKSPFYETGLDELITAGLANGTLLATTDYKEAIADADIVISCVGTPDNADGSSNLEYVFSAAKSASQHMKQHAIYVQKSTVPVGTGRQAITLLPSNAYVSNPEFLREGTAVYDTLLYDRIVVGGDDSKALESVQDLYKNIERNAEKISKICGGIGKNEIKNHSGQYIKTTLESAELIKVTSNAFLALKISFANSIAKLCDETNGDVNDVMDAIGADKRIGRAFLNAGRGYGGGCFPKDVSGLISSAKKHGVDMPIMDAVVQVNDSMPGYIIEKTKKKIGTLDNKKVAVLGLSFKAGTSDTRKSRAILLANTLCGSGCKVSTFDPAANEEAKEHLKPEVIICNSADEALFGAEIVFIATEWPEFKNISNWLPGAKDIKVVVDCMNLIDEHKINNPRITYLGVGR